MKAWALILLMTVASVATTPEARAWDQDQRTIVTTSAYGLVIGALAGLATLPIHGKSRTVFQGASVGLYLGIIVGLYHNDHRYDPTNPLRSSVAPGFETAGFEVPELPAAPLQFRWVVASF